MNVPVGGEFTQDHIDKAEYTLQSQARLARFLTAHGLTVEDTVNAWITGHGRPHPNAMSTYDYWVTSVATITSLDETHPGGAVFLNQRANVHNFGRGAVDFWRYQCDIRSQTVSRTVTALSATYDPEGAFMHGTYTVANAFAALPQTTPTALLYTEISRLDDLKLAEAAQFQSGAQGTDTVIFDTHGRQHGRSIVLSADHLGNKPDVVIDSTTLRSHLAPFLGSMSHEYTTVAYLACDTGAEDDGFAAQSHALTQLATIAPQHEVAVSQITFHEQQGVLFPEVAFVHANVPGQPPAPTRVFYKSIPTS